MNKDLQNSGDAVRVKIPEKLIGIREKVGYAFGDTASVLYWHTWSQFLLIYYTDVFGISAVAVGVMFGVTRLFDAVNDPLMGLIADQTKSKYGKFRPWLIWGILPYMTLGVLLFTVPSLSESGKLVYAYITYIGVSVVYTMVNIPYGALMGVMTPHSHERTVLASFRFYGAYAAVFFVNLTLLKLVDFFGDGDAAVGYQRTMIVYALIAGLLFFTVFATTKERVQPPKDQKTDLKADLAQLLKNKPWMAVFGIGILTLIWVTMRNSATLYYLKYYVGLDDAESGFMGIGLTSWFLGIGTAGTFAGVAATGWCEKHLGGKRSAYIILTIATGVVTCGFYFANAERMWLLYAVHVLGSALTGPLMPLFWSMIADTADYSEWKFGRRTTGLIFSAGTFSQKSGGALGGALAGLFLGYIGYVANADQAPETVEGLKAMMSYVPSLIGVVSALAVLLYGISPELAKRIEVELAERHAKEGNPSV